MIRFFSAIGFFFLGTQLIDAQEKKSQISISIFNENNEKVEGTIISTNNSAAKTNTEGIAVFNISEGKHILKISHPSYQEKELKIDVSGPEALEIKLQQVNRLDEVVIFSKESKGLTTKSVITRQAMRHLQPSSFTDLLELLPGGLAKNPNPTSSNRITLRENPGDLMGNNYQTSSLGVQFMIDDNIINSNSDMQISVDQSQFLEAAKSRKTAYTGVDMRTISTNDIEKVEIIRGIPSASYGDLTSGLVKIERKISKTPLQARFKADGFSKQYYVGKGFAINNSWQINASFDYLDSKNSPTDDYENFERATASIRTKKKFTFLNNLLEWRSNIDFSSNLDNKRYDPDNAYPSTD